MSVGDEREGETMKTLEEIAVHIGQSETQEALWGLLDHMVVLRRREEMQRDAMKPVDPISSLWYERAMTAEAALFSSESAVQSTTEAYTKVFDRLVWANRRILQLEAELRARCIEPEEITT